MSLHAPRYYQSAVIQGTYDAWAAGHRNVVVVMPTGAGKTFVFAHIAAAVNMAVCAVAHRSELVSQMSLALAREGVRHRVIGPAAVARACRLAHLDELGIDYTHPNARVAVAGVDTLIRMDVSEPYFTQVGLWIMDEAHHVLTDNKWGKAVKLFPNARGLGVTATPNRADGKGLGAHADGVFHEMIVGPTMRDLINEGFLTEYRIFAPPSDIDLSQVALSASGDFSPKPLAAARKASHITGDVVQHYLRIARGKLGVTFDVDIEAATAAAAAFNAAGVPAKVVTGNSTDEYRAHALKQFRNREILQLVNVDLFGEGFDLPAIEVVSMARPTQSYPLYVQQFGRTLRILAGKTHGIIIDHVGNVLRHGLPDMPRGLSLDRRERRGRGTPLDVIPLRACLNPECAGVYERVLPACPYCGHMHVSAGRSSPEQVDGDLCELDPTVLARMRGEISRVDGDAVIPYGADRPTAVAVRRRHEERQASQKRLRAAIALWGGWQTSLGRDHPEGYKRFWFRFGTDVASAMTLGSREAESLAERIENDLNVNNVRELK
jgi:DNA repair protein RadD